MYKLIINTPTLHLRARLLITRPVTCSHLQTVVVFPGSRGYNSAEKTCTDLGSASERAKGPGGSLGKVASFSPVLFRRIIGQIRCGRGRKGKHKCWKRSLGMYTLLTDGSSVATVCLDTCELCRLSDAMLSSALQTLSKSRQHIDDGLKKGTYLRPLCMPPSYQQQPSLTFLKNYTRIISSLNRSTAA